MNKQRRKKLTQALEYLQKAYSIIEEAQSEEDEAKDNLPESLQSSERYYDMEQCVDDLQEVLDSLDNAESYLSEYCLETAEEKKSQEEGTGSNNTKEQLQNLADVKLKEDIDEAQRQYDDIVKAKGSEDLSDPEIALANKKLRLAKARLLITKLKTQLE